MITKEQANFSQSSQARASSPPNRANELKLDELTKLLKAKLFAAYFRVFVRTLDLIDEDVQGLSTIELSFVLPGYDRAAMEKAADPYVVADMYALALATLTKV